MADVPRKDLPPELLTYLFDGEVAKIKMVISRWRLWKPIALSAAGMLVWLLLIGNVDAVRNSVKAEGWLFIVFVWSPLSWLIWEYVDWKREYFIVTDRRLMLVHGVINRDVAIMPLGKVTDMLYRRSPVGKLLGYGTFIFESAGQDQALSKVYWVRDPDVRYRDISALIFAPSSRRAYDKLLPFSTGSALPISEPEEAWWKR